jgi:glutathione S-transferase
VWGDHFNSDTRTLLGILKIANVPHSFEKVNMLNEEHRKESYLIQNPSGQIPMITEGPFKVIGGGNTLINYLINAHKPVAEHLYPEPLRAEVEKFLNWFQSKMRPETQRLVRMIVPAKVLGGTPASNEEKLKQRNTIYEKHGLLSVLDKKLEKTGSYVCGDQMTVVDVLFYCEISTVLSLTLKSEDELGANNPNINTWYLRMKTVPGMAELDNELADIVKKFDLAEK